MEEILIELKKINENLDRLRNRISNFSNDTVHNFSVLEKLLKEKIDEAKKDISKHIENKK